VRAKRRAIAQLDPLAVLAPQCHVHLIVQVKGRSLEKQLRKRPGRHHSKPIGKTKTLWPERAMRVQNEYDFLARLADTIALLVTAVDSRPVR
jgi:hypothetical protein